MIGCRMKRKVIGPPARSKMLDQNRCWTSSERPYQKIPSTSSTAEISTAAQVRASANLDGGASTVMTRASSTRRREAQNDPSMYPTSSLPPAPAVEGVATQEGVLTRHTNLLA